MRMLYLNCQPLCIDTGRLLHPWWSPQQLWRPGSPLWRDEPLVPSVRQLSSLPPFCLWLWSHLPTLWISLSLSDARHRLHRCHHHWPPTNSAQACVMFYGSYFFIVLKTTPEELGQRWCFTTIFLIQHYYEANICLCVLSVQLKKKPTI